MKGAGRFGILEIVQPGDASLQWLLRRFVAGIPKVHGAQERRANMPGVQHDESTDSDAFDCHDAPGFQLNSAEWDYDTYTWHTNRDTFDKISWREVEKNAIFVAMLAYEASEDPSMVPRTRRIPVAPPGTRGGPPSCENPPRSYKATQVPRPPGDL